MIQPPFPYSLRRMTTDDIPHVIAIENESFPVPWPAKVYRNELTRNARAHCLVLEMDASTQPAKDGKVSPARCTGSCVGYGCFWLMEGEARVSTLAVAPPWRCRGLGELLLLALIDEANSVGAELLALEVRVSNRVAQRLYAKYGLGIVGRRKRYYTNNGEDALIMTVELLGKAYQARLAQRKATLFSRLSGVALRPLPIDVCDARRTGRSPAA